MMCTDLAGTYRQSHRTAETLSVLRSQLSAIFSQNKDTDSVEMHFINIKPSCFFCAQSYLKPAWVLNEDEFSWVMFAGKKLIHTV